MVVGGACMVVVMRWGGGNYKNYFFPSQVYAKQNTDFYDVEISNKYISRSLIRISGAYDNTNLRRSAIK